jgi:hypothetical protein
LSLVLGRPDVLGVHLLQLEWLVEESFSKQVVFVLEEILAVEIWLRLHTSWELRLNVRHLGSSHEA